jgi:hypothetical protein
MSGIAEPVKLPAVPEREGSRPSATTGDAPRDTPRGGLLPAFLLYALLAVLTTWPLAGRLATGVPHDLADPLLNTWILWWNAQAVPFSSEWWSGPMFHPIPGVLSFSENLVGLSPLTTPLQWLGAPPLAAYNVAFILSFALSAFSMLLLARALGLGAGPSLVAGLAFGFAPHRAAHLAHLQVLAAYLIPLVFLAAHRYAQTGRRAWLGLFGAAWLVQGLTNGYFLVYVSVLFAAWLAWFARAMPDRRRAAGLLVAWALAVASLAPVLWRYSQWHSAYGFERRIEEIESLSADVRGLFAPAPGLANWPSPPWLAPGSCLFPGLTVTLLLVLLAGGWLRRRPRDEGRVALVFVVVAAGAALVAAVTALTGPWRLSIAGLALSVKALSKPLAIALYALVLGTLSSHSFRDAWKRGSVPVFYVVAAAAAVVLSFGPNPVAGDLKVWDKAPYYYLLKLPGLSALRAPTRFAMLGVFCLALAATSALARILARRRGRQGAITVAIVAAGVLWDGWLARLPIPDAPVHLALPEEAPGVAVLELPVGEEQDTSAMYRGMGHRRPVVNGYSGYPPPHYLALRSGLLRGEPDVLEALRERGPLLVLVDGSAKDADALRRLVHSLTGVRSLGEQQGRGAYVLARVEPRPDPALGGRLPARLVHGSPRRAVFELERPGPLGGVLLHLGAGVSSLPAAVTVETGDTGSWTIRWRGPVAGRALRGALRDPKRVPVVIATPGASGRLVRIRVDGIWTIEEVVLLGRGGDRRSAGEAAADGAEGAEQREPDARPEQERRQQADPPP